MQKIVMKYIWSIIANFTEIFHVVSLLVVKLKIVLLLLLILKNSVTSACVWGNMFDL